jgi:hypothetical protein
MGPRSTGHPEDRVYARPLPLAPAGGLAPRADPKHPFEHALIEPASSMPLPAYEALLVGTRPEWRQVWP